MSKKILLIIGILVIIGIAVFLMWGVQPKTDGENRVGFSLRDYLPFGNSGNSEIGTTTETMPAEKSSPILDNIGTGTPRLRKISNEPVAGGVIFNIGTTSVVRFVEKGTGNVYEVKSNSLNTDRLTNTTIPKIVRAFWLPDGSGFLAQTLITQSEIVETSFIKLNKKTASSTNESLTPYNTSLSKLPTGIKEISLKPDGSKIFYYTGSGSSNWYISNPDGTLSTLIYSHPLSEWLPKWISPNILIMQTKASMETTGYNYIFDIQNKTLKKVGGGVLGLSNNPNTDGVLNLVSSGGSIPQLFIINNSDLTSKRLNINSLADKCVWTKEKSATIYCAVPNQLPRANYPDAWYKGLINTEDSIQKIDTVNDIFYNTADLSRESGELIDVIDLNISPDQSHLLFRNKKDGFLWLLRIEE